MVQEVTLDSDAQTRAAVMTGTVTTRVLPVHMAKLGCPEGTHSMLIAPASELYGRK